MNNNRPYKPQDYDPVWKERYRELKEKLKPLFGDDLVSIEHVGSTSIEGMYAKPQIDVLVVVNELDRVPRAYDKLEQAGFTIQGRNYVPGEEYVTEDVQDGRRLASIHILGKGQPKIEEYRMFRDYLQTHQEERELYIERKKDLYKRHPDNYESYVEGKKGLISEIKERARKWRS